jgi:glycosyltransferase involved in cell wall biosynthesis
MDVQNKGDIWTSTGRDWGGFLYDPDPGPGDFVSVVMPTFNQEKYICQAVNSVCEQDYPEFELIVVNDGSTDGTRDYLSTITCSKVKVINLPKNKGTGNALNVGFEAAQGNFETWFASDNVMYPYYLKTLARALQYRHDVDFVYGNFEIIYIESGIKKHSTEIMKMKFRESHLLNHCNLGICWMWRKELREAAGGRYVEHPCEDYEMAVRMMDNGKFVYLDTPVLALYRQHIDNMTVKVNSVPRPVYHDLRLRFFEDRIADEYHVPVVKKRRKLEEVFV